MTYRINNLCRHSHCPNRRFAKEVNRAKITGRALLSVFAVCVALSFQWINDAQAQREPVITISPRFYLTWIESSDFAEPALTPMAGLSISIAPIANWDFTINGLYGEGTSDFTNLAKSASGFGADGELEVMRADIEALARYRVPNSPAYVVAGFRYIDFQEEFKTNAGVVVEETESNFYFGEFGGGFATRISQSGRHSVFANGVIGLGVFDQEENELGLPRREDDGFAFLFDANIGYQYAISGSISLSTRYRIIAVQEGGNESNLAVVHGPEIAASFRF